VHKNIRMALGSVLAVAGIVFFILPGSILFLLGGLLLLSYDFPRARVWLKSCQRAMSGSAQKIDRLIRARKLRS